MARAAAPSGDILKGIPHGLCSPLGSFRANSTSLRQRLPRNPAPGKFRKRAISTALQRAMTQSS
jgi:hypothetical protein